ncbi:hypothetical protein TSTA_019800 [Talaromyces stipitatus ATCC 10500]|uniref:Uncharacterized protein n=1 Tax=Talaromyces stipitatus (strain ATCC 10500 / CBS 375.48 / QM 6759 / NRRL 1006) TaxID=441959 RepID=B8MEN6_TALSN|nr:uncharacterized protein TSTA_019800 [Talaromyces stipitatus ATCC 10500]EED16919.1 hypothetical protein TSTA_019800 [Talaromyces stipitatus ATCC 10500]
MDLGYQDPIIMEEVAMKDASSSKQSHLFLFATNLDTFGRRPIYLITYSITPFHSAPLILRAVQSLGASSVPAVAYGGVADICIHAERGIHVRTDDGSGKSGYMYWTRISMRRSSGYHQIGNMGRVQASANAIFLIRWVALPFSSRKIRRWFCGWPLRHMPSITASKHPTPPYSRTFMASDELTIGLVYLPGGVGVVLGGYLNGRRLMDYNHAITEKKISQPIDPVSGNNDLDNFPIEKARARGCWTFNALLVDLFPSNPGTAAEASNITRCVLSAVAVAIMQPLVDAMGIGWFFSLLALISGGGGLAANFAITRFGTIWRGQRLAKTRR